MSTTSGTPPSSLDNRIKRKKLMALRRVVS
jgi:hypothetical protein